MTLPLYRVPGPGLQLMEFEGADYARLIYRTQQAFAIQVQNGGQGRIFQGNGGARIGSSLDTRATPRTNRNPSRFPAFPGTGRADVTYNYGFTPSTVGQPGLSTSGPNEGWLTYTGTAPGDVTFVTDVDIQNVIDRIITPAATNLRSGGVGSFRVSTNSPGAGWTNLGRWFRDSRFNGNTDYNLWLRSTTGVPGQRRPLQTGFTEMDTGANGNFVQNICLPLLTRVAPSYRIRNDGAGAFGTWTDTRLTGTRNQRIQRGQDAYDSISTPTGGATLINTYSLEMV